MALQAKPGQGCVVVVGAGYAGIELATTLAERLDRSAHVRVVDAGTAMLIEKFSSTTKFPRGLACHHTLGYPLTHPLTRACPCNLAHVFSASFLPVS